jgi:undecaprenyl-phosphate 4-deoxy-4-formamido-L-arabinose transferase
MTLQPRISVVIPVYRSESILPALVQRLQPVLASSASEYELVLVDDGSPDRSWEAIERLSAQHAWVHGIRLMRNYGQHNALLAGIRAARYDIIVTMDDDLQHPPEELPKLLATLEQGFDVVYGTPEQQQHGLLRNLASVITKIVLRSAMGADTARVVGAWRVFRAQVRDAFSSYSGPFVNIDVLLTWGTTRFGSVRVRHDSRAAGKSNYDFFTLARHALNMMTGFSVLPLQLASVVGFTFTLFGLGVLAYVVGRYLISGTSVAGFPFLASIIAIFSGAQLFTLGIIGEYLARMHFRTMDKPPYVIRMNCKAQ